MQPITRQLNPPSHGLFTKGDDVVGNGSKVQLLYRPR